METMSSLMREGKWCGEHFPIVGKCEKHAEPKFSIVLIIVMRNLIKMKKSYFHSLE